MILARALNYYGAGGGIRTHAARKGHGLSRGLLGSPGPRPNRHKACSPLGYPGTYNYLCLKFLGIITLFAYLKTMHNLNYTII